MLPARTVAFIAAVCMGANVGVLAAQGPDPSRAAVRLRAAAGTDVGILDDYVSGRNVLGAVGLEWSRPRAPLSARLELVYSKRDEVSRSKFLECESCRYAHLQELVGLSADARYTLLATERVRPYVLTGIGLYYASNKGSAFNCAPSGCSPPPPRDRHVRESVLTPGFHNGFGLALPVRGREASVEFRIRQLTSGVDRSLGLPLTFGLRF